MNYTGSDVLLTSSASGTTISLTPTPATNQEFAITYLTGTTESATVNTANKIFTLPSVGFIGCISYAVWTDTLESMITDVRTALNALAVTNNTSAADIEASVEAAINNASLTVSWKQPFFKLRAVNGAIVRVDGVEKGRTDVRDGLVSGILTLTDGEESAISLLIFLFRLDMKHMHIGLSTWRLHLCIPWEVLLFLRRSLPKK